MNDKKAFELNLKSQAFTEFCCNFNTAIIECLSELYEGNFEGGDIAAKVSIEIERGVEFFPTTEMDENGKIKEKSYHYKKPNIEHKVTLTLKKRAEAKGGYVPHAMELKKDNDQYLLSPVTKAQLSLDELTSDVIEAVINDGIVDSLGRVGK